MSFDFSYTRDTMPSPHSACIVWRKTVDEATGEEWVAMDTNLMYLHQEEDGALVWKILSTDEVLKNQNVVKYIEIPRRYWSGLVNLGNPFYRLRMFLRGCKFVEKNQRYEPKTYTPTFKRKVRCDKCKKED